MTSELFKDHPLAAVGLAAVAAADDSDVTAELQQFEAAIRDYSLNRTGVDWPLVERAGSAVAAQRCDLKIYSYLAIAAFSCALDDSDASPYLALGASLHALGDLIEKGWERCTPRLPARRQTQLKWLSEELSIPVKGRPPRPAELPAFMACLEEAERVAELSGKALGLDYPLLRELREVLTPHKPAAPQPPPTPPPAAKPAPPPQPAPPPAEPAIAPAPVAAVAAPSSVELAKSPAIETPPIQLPANPASLSREALEDKLSELVALLAAQLRAESLADPAPYWLLRALRWASHDLLRPERVQEVIANKYQTVLPPPSDHKSLMKQFLARLADGQHADVLADCEELFVTYPLWLDLQRFVTAALDALGAAAARQVVTSEVLLLLARCPEITRFRFSDRDATPLADSDTVTWLDQEQKRAGPSGPQIATKESVDSVLIVTDELEPGVRTLQKAIAQAGHARRRFELQLQLAEFLLVKQRSDIAMPIVDALLSAVEAHRLADWQPELCEQALRLAVRTGRAAAIDAERRAALWGRLCQLSPLAALIVGPETLSE